MKSTGIVRKIDDLGRIVIPKEIRRLFELKENSDALEIFVDENTIILKKYDAILHFLPERQRHPDLQGPQHLFGMSERTGAEGFGLITSYL